MFDPDYIPSQAFYAEAEPCESCGAPTFLGRVWNQEHELWIAQDCSCNSPDLPTCPLLIPLLESASTVQQVCDVIRSHRKTCQVCGPKEIKTGLPANTSGRGEEPKAA